jgi:LacI family transcriptional regulator
VITMTEGDRIDGADAVRLLLPHARRPDFPTALIAYNTLMAAGAVRELGRANWAVPGRISLASADFSPVATDSTPRITAAGSNPEALGEAAARLVLESPPAADASCTDLMLPARLFVGDTTGPARE